MLFICDENNHRIQYLEEITPNSGNFPTQANTAAANTNGLVNYPWGIAFLPNGSFVFTNPWDYKLKQFD